MRRTPSLLAYLATHRGQTQMPDPQGARPEGAVIWAICSHRDQLLAVQTLRARLDDDGEAVTFLSYVIAEHDGRFPDATYLAQLNPVMVIWLAETLDPRVIYEVKRAKVPIIFAAVDADAILRSDGRWWPGLVAQMLRNADRIFAIDQANRRKLVRLGARADRTISAGPLEQSLPPQSYNEDDRAFYAAEIGTRPVWLAAQVPLAEAEAILAAHRAVTRRAHRLLLVLSPRDLATATGFTRIFSDAGMTVLRASDGQAPRDSTQVFILDRPDDLALWARLSPMAYLGGSLSDGDTPDPLIFANVGSAILCGPRAQSYVGQLNRLEAAHALRRMPNAQALAIAIEAMMATDTAARYAHAAWDVTSRGAEVTDQLIDTIYTYLDAGGR